MDFQPAPTALFPLSYAETQRDLQPVDMGPFKVSDQMVPNQIDNYFWLELTNQAMNSWKGNCETFVFLTVSQLIFISWQINNFGTFINKKRLYFYCRLFKNAHNVKEEYLKNTHHPATSG